MQEQTVMVDLDKHGIAELEARFDVLDAILERGRVESHVQNHHCDHCHKWVPVGALICWSCHTVLGMTGA